MVRVAGRIERVFDAFVVCPIVRHVKFAAFRRFHFYLHLRQSVINDTSCLLILHNSNRHMHKCV